ncbi:ArsR/SmtB family transcription factor [Streptomyces sp. NPDC059740]|uniref:ArsR/SmtB family transcription factor n=1 Tax=Streptomyces sp. NPDC059740 TaxID=3346926 RepID=UPI00364A8701
MSEGGTVMAEADSRSRDLAEAFKAVSNPSRLQIMQWLRDPDAHFGQFEADEDRRAVGVCASHIQAKAGLAPSTVSQHLSVLQRAGLVHTVRRGRRTHFRRNERRIAQLADALMATL